jgi:signal transduction histidine kinase
MSGSVAWLRDVERWIGWIRVGGVFFAVFQIGVIGERAPPGHIEAAWATTGVLAVGAVVFWFLARRELSERTFKRVGLFALAHDTAIVSSYVLIYAFEPGTPIRQLLFVPIVEAALRYGLRGGIALPVVVAPVYFFFELRAEEYTGRPFDVNNITFGVGVTLITGLIVGWLVNRLWRQTDVAETRAAEAEGLRDELGRRVDILESAGRCARALASSLDMEEAFSVFIRELRGLVPFERTAIVLAEGNVANVVATAGRGADTVLRPGTLRAIENSLIAEVLRGETIYREDMSDTRYAEEEELLSLGLRSRVAAPLLAGSRAIGMISVVREAPRSFSRDEIELLTLLGRFVATAVQNIRAYEGERRTVEELRRLSALRADFVSLVSHELRSPMATVIGSARTLQARWRELTPAQRESFLALIGDETSRLASLVGDVLDTSRIEAGTFTYTFDDVDLDVLLRDVVSVLDVGQDEVSVHAHISESLPTIRGDAERLRQVLANLIENAVKYSPAGESVDVLATASNGRVQVSVTDRGPGIPIEDHGLIFEKFGRARSGKTVPGTGLGLFIARSIAEAHGGSLEVQSSPDHGATFTLSLPVPDDERRA